MVMQEFAKMLEDYVISILLIMDILYLRRERASVDLTPFATIFKVQYI